MVKFIVEGEAAAAEEGVVEVAAFVYEDGLIELRIGSTPTSGYEAEQRIKSNEGDGWIIKLEVGDQLVVGEIRQSSSRSTTPHSFTISELGINFPLHADEAGGPAAPWKFFFFDEGIYTVGDAHGDEHGTATIIVGDPVIGGYRPVTYTLDEIRVRDTIFELRMGDTIAWGYGDDPRSAAADRIRTDEVGDITITINVGDTLLFPDGLTGSGSATETHFITIDEFGINAEIAPGADTNADLEITPTKAGTFRLYCSLHPDPAVHGNFFIVVNEPPGAAPEPVVYTLNMIRIRDGLFDVRMGDTAYWGYDAGMRVESGPYEGKPGQDVLMTINVGDSIVFESGVNGSNGNTETHFLTIDALGIDIELAPGSSTDPGYTIAPTEPGTYRLYCSAHPDDHGSVLLVVEAVAVGGPEPVVYTLQQVRVRDTIFDVRMGDTTAWGYQAGMRVESGPYEGKPGQDVFLTINVGDSIVFERGINGSNGNTETHFFTIDALGIDIELPPNGEDQAGEDFTLAPTEAGNYRIYCSAHPDDHGNVYIIVVDAAAAEPGPVTYTLNMIRIRDGLFDVRMGDTAYWGYDAGMRVESGPYEGKPGQDVFLTINVGDSIVFDSGVNGSNGNTETHFLTIDELGIDIELAPGSSTDPGYTIAPTEAGNYRVYCSAHPDDHGLVYIIVQ